MKTLLAPTIPQVPTRLGTWATGSRPPVLTDEEFPQPKVQAGAADLRAIREADLHRALARLADTGTTVLVGRYSLVGPRQDPAGRLAEAQAVIHRRRWTTSITTFDTTEGHAQALRPQLARLFAALDAGEIHGIVAVSQADISPFPDTYAHTLTVLRARRGFLALARNETSI
ncbi:hypothetical protein ACWECC_22635 [Streptomyces microflavus]